MIKIQQSKTKMRVITLIFMLCITATFLLGQKSKWQLHVGYEQMYVHGKTTNDVAQRHWIWDEPNRGKLFTMRTSLTHGYKIGISYDLFPWWSICYSYRNYYRRYYVWSGTFHNAYNKYTPNHEVGKFEIYPYVGFLYFPSMLLGRTVSSKTWSFGSTFSHKLSKSGKWRINYSFFVNTDLYENDLQYFDTPVHYGTTAWYTDLQTQELIKYELKGRFQLSAYNPGQSPYSVSTNQSIGITRLLRNGMGLNLEFGFRGIRFLKKTGTLLDENHWDLDLTYTEYQDEKNTVRYESNINYHFPLYLGGFYSGLTFTCRPFRSKRDNPEWKPWFEKYKERRREKRRNKSNNL